VNKAAWCAMIMIHCSSLPSVVNSMVNQSAQLPPVSLVVMVWSGLLILFVKAIRDGDKVYMYGNGAGLLINSLTLWHIAAR
jgi:lipid-A-disaccharide synthase-like uncharacterized protein